MALELPSGFRDALVEWRSEVFAGRDDVRVIAPEALHVTLIFLGYLPEKAIGRLASLLADAALGVHGPRLSPLAVKPLPPRRPRLFALELADEDGRASALQGRLSDRLEAERLYRPEKRPFWPHLTLARVKRGRAAAPLENPASPPREMFEAVEVVLYRSHLSPAGARYEALARVPISGQ